MENGTRESDLLRQSPPTFPYFPPSMLPPLHPNLHPPNLPQSHSRNDASQHSRTTAGIVCVPEESLFLTPPTRKFLEKKKTPVMSNADKIIFCTCQRLKKNFCNLWVMAKITSNFPSLSSLFKPSKSWCTLLNTCVSLGR